MRRDDFIYQFKHFFFINSVSRCALTIIGNGSVPSSPMSISHNGLAFPTALPQKEIWQRHCLEHVLKLFALLCRYNQMS